MKDMRTGVILTWVCEFCGWANDNNNGPCRKCGGQVESQMVKGYWRRVVVRPPNQKHHPMEKHND